MGDARYKGESDVLGSMSDKRVRSGEMSKESLKTYILHKTIALARHNVRQSNELVPCQV